GSNRNSNARTIHWRNIGLRDLHRINFDRRDGRALPFWNDTPGIVLNPPLSFMSGLVFGRPKPPEQAYENIAFLKHRPGPNDPSIVQAPSLLVGEEGIVRCEASPA